MPRERARGGGGGVRAGGGGGGSPAGQRANDDNDGGKGGEDPGAQTRTVGGAARGSRQERFAVISLTLTVSIFCGSLFAKAQFFNQLQQANAVNGGWWSGAMPVISFLMDYESGNKLETDPFGGPPGLLLVMVASFLSLMSAAGYMMISKTTTSAVISGFIFIQLMVCNEAEGKTPVRVEEGKIKVLVSNPEQASAFFELLGTSHLMECTALIMCTAMCVYACVEQRLSAAKAAVLAGLGFATGLMARASGVDAAVINGISVAEVRRFASSNALAITQVVHGGDLASVPMLTASITFVLVLVLARVVSFLVFRSALSSFSTACVVVGMAFAGSYVEPNLSQLAELPPAEVDAARGLALLKPMAEGHLGELCAWTLAALFAAGDALAPVTAGSRPKFE